MLALWLRYEWQRGNRLIAGAWAFWLISDFARNATPFRTSWDVLWLVISVWLGWKDDDNWKRRRKRAKEAIKAFFRSFAPSPIPMPGAA